MTGGTRLALIWIELLAPIAMSLGISRIGTRCASIIIHRIRFVVLLLALLTIGAGVLGHGCILFGD
jgi:hypothetical protein